MNQNRESTKTFLLIGATSAIAQATARHFAADGYRCFLAGRDPDKLQRVAEDLRSRGSPDIHKQVFDALDEQTYKGLIASASESLGQINVALVAHGTLPDQESCEGDITQAQHALTINYVSAVLLVNELARVMKKQGQGTIAVISSVAGDRGRPSNYLYGSAKAGLNTYLDGLRIKLADSGVNVLTIKPGLVDTPMTADMKKGLLWASANQVGERIFQAVNKRYNQVYAPWYWRYIMIIVKILNRKLIKKL